MLLEARGIVKSFGAFRAVDGADLAVAEGISASAVSQRVRHDGLAAVVAADELVRRVS